MGSGVYEGWEKQVGGDAGSRSLGKQDSEFKDLRNCLVRMGSLFFKAFQNGRPNWKRASRILSRPAAGLACLLDRPWAYPRHVCFGPTCRHLTNAGGSSRCATLLAARVILA